ncbi:DUF2637 domain-containing protein [Virgisporangium ochraceum]|uniref:DUF2637 domain-containing protein n=1 Tax=Virgisporangium ochraceum TaxID=65505 RepID=A0A8J3ZTF9_9ACTN|nr:DUF2637 domain-containing protein [Virgisporangium ochraceum]GIJ69569.1 hypothetical protein Voc01_044860 [Virgisporangium ochraceum]
MSLRQLRRVRWAVRAVLVLGVAASVAANILHADPNPIAQAIAAWPPLALLLTVELISRVPVHRRSLAAVRLGATATIAGIAAWVSYWHMAGVAARYGETGAAPYLLPLSVDGLVVVASVSLVELAGRLRSASPPEDQTQMGRAATDSGATPTSGYGPVTTQIVEPKPIQEPKPVLDPQLGELIGERLAAARPRNRTTTTAATGRATASARVPGPAAGPAAGRASVPAARRGRPAEETRRLAAELAARDPDATTDDLAKQLGISTSRLKRVLADA